MNASEIGLSTKASVLKEASAIAKYHLGGETASAKECIFQGMFSRTVDVAMKDKKHYVVQFRSESVHKENAQQARDILGDVVPVPVRVIREGSPVPYAYVMPCVPGFTWDTIDRRSNWPAVNYVKVAGQIGDMIGRCCTTKTNSERHVINTLIIPRLQLYLAWDDSRLNFHPIRLILGFCLILWQLTQSPRISRPWYMSPTSVVADMLCRVSMMKIICRMFFQMSLPSVGILHI